MNLSNFIHGLEILQRYFNNPGTVYPLCSEHDELYVSNTDRPLHPVDLACLKHLGWFQRVGLEDGEYKGEYDPGEPWCCHV